ncbi:MAG: hypothetical protein ACKVH8_07265 [Pirellulales bacterium]
MKYHPADIDINPADAEDVRLQFESGDLVLSYLDWKDVPHAWRFQCTLAFKWDDELDFSEIRDDSCYEVQESSWLSRQAKLSAVEPANYTHYKLCFNACGVLDVICESVKVEPCV